MTFKKIRIYSTLLCALMLMSLCLSACSFFQGDPRLNQPDPPKEPAYVDRIEIILDGHVVTDNKIGGLLGDIYDFSAKVYPSDAIQDVKWSLENVKGVDYDLTNVATISKDGQVKIKGEGSFKVVAISADDRLIFDRNSFTVEMQVDNVSANIYTVEQPYRDNILGVGDKLTMNVNLDKFGSNVHVFYKVDDNSTGDDSGLNINQDTGEVTALYTGNYTIEADITDDDGDVLATIENGYATTINVVADDSLEMVTLKFIDKYQDYYDYFTNFIPHGSFEENSVFFNNMSDIDLMDFVSEFLDYNDEVLSLMKNFDVNSDNYPAYFKSFNDDISRYFNRNGNLTYHFARSLLIRVDVYDHYLANSLSLYNLYSGYNEYYGSQYISYWHITQFEDANDMIDTWYDSDNNYIGPQDLDYLRNEVDQLKLSNESDAQYQLNYDRLSYLLDNTKFNEFELFYFRCFTATFPFAYKDNNVRLSFSNFLKTYMENHSFGQKVLERMESVLQYVENI